MSRSAAGPWFWMDESVSSGHSLFPLSWQHMHCAHRSVARFSRFLQLGDTSSLLTRSCLVLMVDRVHCVAPLWCTSLVLTGGDVMSFGSELLLLRHTSCADVLSPCEQTSILVLGLSKWRWSCLCPSFISLKSTAWKSWKTSDGLNIIMCFCGHQGRLPGGGGNVSFTR